MRYLVYDYILIIPRIMDEYKWTRVSLMGHSMGGYINFLYAALSPHTVDMLISLDIVIPIPLLPGYVTTLGRNLEKQLLEEERAEQLHLKEPPSYTISQLCEAVSKGSNGSVPAEFAHHLLYRSITKSKIYPDKYYFSRDGRVKYYSQFNMELGLAAEMAKRIKNKPYLIIKGSKSEFIRSYFSDVLAILKEQNHYEFYELEGTHHVHLHSASACAKYIVPFIRRYRPPPLYSWSLVDKEAELSHQQQRKAQERFFVSQQKRHAIKPSNKL